MCSTSEGETGKETIRSTGCRDRNATTITAVTPRYRRGTYTIIMQLRLIIDRTHNIGNVRFQHHSSHNYFIQNIMYTI